MFVLALLAAVGAMPLGRDRVLNGRHGRHDRSLSALTHCEKATYAYGSTVSSAAPPANTPYTVVCEAAGKGDGWTYNTQLPALTVDTYNNATGAIAIDSPNACIPAHEATLFVTQALDGRLQPFVTTQDMYWIRSLHLTKSGANRLGTNGVEDKMLLYAAAAKSCTTVEVSAIATHRTGPFYFAVTDRGVFQARVLETDYDVNDIDHERVKENSFPVGTTLSYHLVAAVLGGLSSALPIKYPWAHLQNAASGALYFTAAFVCGSECAVAKPASLVAASLAVLRLGIDLLTPNSRLRVLAAVLSHASAAVVTFSFFGTADGVWVPPALLVQLQGSLNSASALELFPAIWQLL